MLEQYTGVNKNDDSCSYYPFLAVPPPPTPPPPLLLEKHNDLLNVWLYNIILLFYFLTANSYAINLDQVAENAVKKICFMLKQSRTILICWFLSIVQKKILRIISYKYIFQKYLEYWIFPVFSIYTLFTTIIYDECWQDYKG